MVFSINFRSMVTGVHGHPGSNADTPTPTNASTPMATTVNAGSGIAMHPGLKTAASNAPDRPYR